jgi:hypothetical protein
MKIVVKRRTTIALFKGIEILNEKVAPFKKPICVHTIKKSALTRQIRRF